MYLAVDSQPAMPMFANAQTVFLKHTNMRWGHLLVTHPSEAPHMYQRSRLPFFAALIFVTLSVMGCSKVPETAAVARVAAADIGQVSDTDVTHHVHTAFLQSELLKGFEITVVTLKGDVRLIGVLDNQAQIDEAVRLARASDGAHTIHDEFTLKK